MPAWATAIISLVVKGLFSWIGSNEAEAAKDDAASSKEALNTVGGSVKIESDIRKGQEKVEDEEIKITTDDGGFSFGDNK